jgi:hypothetical protein
LGKITEQDVRSTFAAFRRLDLDNDGRLTSKEIILSAVEEERKRSKAREDINKSFTSRSPEKRSFLMNSITSVDKTSMDERVLTADAKPGERMFLLSRKEQQQHGIDARNHGRYVHGSSIDYGCVESGVDQEIGDIESGKKVIASGGPGHLFSPIAPGRNI